MAITLLVLRAALAAVFGVAGATKLVSLGATMNAAVGFGLPRRAAPAVAVALPLVEIAIAFGLVGRAASQPAAVAAAALMAIFLLLTSVTVARGRAVSCNCFGSLSAATVSGRTVARNTVLLAIAVPTAWLAVIRPVTLGVPYARFDGLTWTVVALGLLVAALAAAFARVAWILFEQYGRVLIRLDQLAGTPPPAPQVSGDGLPAGSAAPAFVLPTLSNEQLALTELTARQRPVLLVFADPGCGPCAEVMPWVAGWQREHANVLTAVVVATGSREANLAKAGQHGLATVLLDDGGAVARSFRSPGTPSAVLIGADGRMAAPIAVGAPAVKTLAAPVIGAGSQTQPASKVGALAPAFRLQDASGTEFTEAYLREQDSTVVLFWNSGCGFCQRMRQRLEEWDRQNLRGRKALLVISTDSGVVADPLRLNAPVLRDEDGGVMRAFGAAGTPVAILVDSSGGIASEVAAGEQAVFDLLGPIDRHSSQLLPVAVGGAS